MKGNELGLGGLAVDEDEVVLLAEGGGELVHDAAGHVGEVMFGLLAEERLFLGVEGGVDETLGEGRGGELEGCGG